MRLFVAVDIPEEMRSKLASLIASLRPLAKLSWSPAENLHITTKFIGEWPEERLSEIQSAVGIVKRPPFELAIHGVGWFPHERAPRVLFVGIHGDASLTELAQATEGALAGIGVPKEDRPYRAHLTLARIRDRVPLDALKRALTTAADFGAFQVHAQHLYLSRSGKYTKLASFSLS